MSQIESPREDAVDSKPSCHGRPSKIIQVLINITLEPTVFLTMLTTFMYHLIAQNLYLEKACRVDIGFNSSICDALASRNASGYTASQEAEVQKLVSVMMGARSVIVSFFPLCLILFIGSWSDRHSRKKPVILVPIIGEILCCIFLILNVIFFYELPLVFTVIGDSLPLALCGGWPCFFIGVYSYVGSKCSNKDRTLRMGAISAARLGGTSLGYSIAGFLFVSVGYLGVFLICILLLSVAFIFAVLFVKDDKVETEHPEGTDCFRNFFDMKHVKNTLGICFKNRQDNRRYKFIIIMFILTAFAGTHHGEFNVKYMYTRLKFRWSAVQYGLFNCILFSSESLGSILAVFLFSRKLRYEDSVLGMIGYTTSVLANILFALASQENLFRCGLILDIFRVTPYIAMRSLMSKIVPPNELTQSNSVFGMAESLLPFTFGPLYAAIYKYTIEVFPGTFFLVTAVIKTIGVFLFLCLYIETKREKKDQCP